MDRVVIKQEFDNVFRNRTSNKRGAKVYGMPVSKEIASYIDDVTVDAQQQRLISMFFAGKFNPFIINDDVEDSDF